jgi:uncharacterized protein YdeI (YjbR/CyaY-like superfamily)
MSVQSEASFYAESCEQLREWLMVNCDRPSGLWLIFNKKKSGQPVMAYNDIVEALLCFGWIDSKPNALDDSRARLWISPRNEKSNWSKINKERVERLIEQGLMTPAGLKKIEAAKSNGAWNALDQVEALELPADLKSALASHAPAELNFEAFPKSVKRNILEWIANAKKPETRSKRIHETVTLAAQNKRANQWRDSH